MPRQHLNSTIHRERDRYAMLRQALWLVCGVLLVGGFVVAVRQQFTAIQYGYKSEELRRERERLLSEQKRLLLALEESSSPTHLERRARELGLQPARPSQMGVAAHSDETRAGSVFVGSTTALRP